MGRGEDRALLPEQGLAVGARAVTVDLKLALIRLLWIPIADDETCTCAPGDQCPLCQAMLALGFERWADSDTAEAQLACLEFRLTRGLEGS